MARFVLIILAAYLAGSVNFSIIFSRAFGWQDPRQRFSGNAGAFNTYRQKGVKWAAPILLLDMGRAGAVSALAFWLLPASQVPWIALALILGNRFPAFHGFKGGKGVANYLGFAAVASPWAAAASCAAWVIVYKIAPEAFLASFAMIAALSIGLAVRCGPGGWSLIGVAAVTALILAAHRRNLRE